MSQERIFSFDRDEPLYPDDVAEMVRVARSNPSIKIYTHTPLWDDSDRISEFVAYALAESPDRAAELWSEYFEEPVKPDEFEECV